MRARRRRIVPVRAYDGLEHAASFGPGCRRAKTHPACVSDGRWFLCPVTRQPRPSALPSAPRTKRCRRRHTSGPCSHTAHTTTALPGPFAVAISYQLCYGGATLIPRWKLQLRELETATQEAGNGDARSHKRQPREPEIEISEAARNGGSARNHAAAHVSASEFSDTSRDA